MAKHYSPYHHTKITLGLTVTNISNKKHKYLIIQKLISSSLSSYAVSITALESAYTATKATYHTN